MIRDLYNLPLQLKTRWGWLNITVAILWWLVLTWAVVLVFVTWLLLVAWWWWPFFAPRGVRVIR